MMIGGMSGDFYKCFASCHLPGMICIVLSKGDCSCCWQRLKGVQVKHCFGFYHLRVFSRTFPSIQCDLTTPTGTTAQKAHEFGSKFFENCAPQSTPLRFKTPCYAHILDEIVLIRMRRGMPRSGTLLFMATILVVQILAVFVCSQAQELSQLN
jgi:hypothetical protein